MPNIHIVNNSISWGPVRHKKRSTKKKSKSSSNQQARGFSSNFWIKDKRRICSMLRLGTRIDPSEASTFVSLVFDKKVHRMWGLSKCQKIFEKFKKYIHKNFPDAWFIYIWEHEKFSGYHVHMWGAFNKKKAWRKIKRKWLALTHSKNEKMCDFQHAKEHHLDYMAAPRKRKGRIKILRELGRKSSWGYINKKNMPLCQVKTLPLTDEELNIFLHYIRVMKFIPRRNCKVSYNLIRMCRRQNGALYLGLTKQIITGALQSVEHFRRRQNG